MTNKAISLLMGASAAVFFASQAAAAPLTNPTPWGVQSSHGLLHHVDTPVSAMPPQMAHAYIVGIQEELAAHGYRPGPADGALGSLTVHAIRTYQRDAGLPVNGVASKELLDHMKFALPKVMAGATPSGEPLGSVTRDMVKRAQAALNARGYESGPVDGVIGRKTTQALRAFQTDAGLPVTGKLDGTLLALLER